MPARHAGIWQPGPGSRVDTQHPLGKGMVARWLFNDPGSGGISDLLLTCPFASLGTGQSWTSAANGWGVSFAGTGIISVGDYDLVVGDECTWLLRFNPTNTTQVAGIANKRIGYNYQQAWSIGLCYERANTLCCVVGTAATTTQCEYDVSTSGWAGTDNLIVASYNKNRASADRWRVYRNGVAQTTVPSYDNALSIVDTSAPIEFGRVNNATLYYSGIISDCGMWSYALDGEEIRQVSAEPYSMIWTPGRKSTWWFSAAGAAASIPIPVLMSSRRRSA